MIQKSCELETDTAGFRQAFPETTLEKIIITAAATTSYRVLC